MKMRTDLRPLVHWSTIIIQDTMDQCCVTVCDVKVCMVLISPYLKNLLNFSN